MWLINQNVTKTQIFLNGKLVLLFSVYSPKRWKSRIRALQFYNFRREHAPRQPSKYSRLLYSNLLATSIFIETPEEQYVIAVHSNYFSALCSAMI